MDLWNNKNIFDMWVILHFCFGLLVAAITYIANVRLALGLSTAIVISVIWEVSERLKGIDENWSNSFSDILATVLAFLFAFYLIKHFQNYNYIPYILIGLSIAVYVILFFAKKITL